MSTPTISRFENGEKDLQVSTVINILSVLGMIDPRKLIFPEEKAVYDPNRMVVIFRGSDNDKVVNCAISTEALEDHLQGDGKNLLDVFKAHRLQIEQLARRKYIEEKFEPNGAILLRSEDFN